MVWLIIFNSFFQVYEILELKMLKIPHLLPVQFFNQINKAPKVRVLEKNAQTFAHKFL